MINQKFHSLGTIVFMAVSISSCGGSGSGGGSIGFSPQASLPASVILEGEVITANNSESVALKWTTENVDKCTATGGWSGNKGKSGNETIKDPNPNKKYSLKCTSDDGVVSDTVDLNDTGTIVPIVSITANPSTVELGGSTTLTWTSENIDTCTGSGDWGGTKQAMDSETLASISTDSTFIINCTGPYGPVNDVAYVFVSIAQQSTGTALLSWTPPTQNTDGSALTDLAGYKVYSGTAPSDYNNSVVIENAGITSYLVENLGPAAWYFAVTSFNTSGIESSFSAEVTKTIN